MAHHRHISPVVVTLLHLRMLCWSMLVFLHSWILIYHGHAVAMPIALMTHHHCIVSHHTIVVLIHHGHVATAITLLHWMLLR